ncbi:hypothetical protein [Thermococcus atlanticus]
MFKYIPKDAKNFTLISFDRNIFGIKPHSQHDSPDFLRRTLE